MANTDEAETIPVEGIHAEEVTDWFATHVPEAQPPLAFDLLAGGRSNLTYSVTEPHQRIVRPKSYADNFIRRI